MNVGDEQRGETSERDGVHAAQIRLLRPYFISARKYGACEGSQRDKTQKNSRKKLAAAKKPGDEREKEIEHLFDGKRPEHAPIAGKPSTLRLQYIDVQRQRGQQRAAKTTRFGGNDKRRDVRIV